MHFTNSPENFEWDVTKINIEAVKNDKQHKKKYIYIYIYLYIYLVHKCRFISVQQL